MFGIGPMELLVIALMGGGLLVPFGVPPLPPDATILASAPEQCLFFASSAGTAQPDPASENQTEQLLAAKEMQTFLSAFATQFTGALEQFGQRDPHLQPLVEVGKPLIETLLSRPAAIYIDRLELAPGAPPAVVAGLIVNCGERKAEVAKAIEALEKQGLARGSDSEEIKAAKVAGVTLRRFVPEPGVEIHWGFKGDYFLVTIGKDAATELVARIGGKGSKPAWMTALEKRAGIKRVSTIRYFDVARLITNLTPMFPNDGFDVPAFLDAAGVADLTSIGAMSGFTTRGMVDRTIANFKSTPKGLFELLAGKPLSADDLKPVPSTAVFAVALRLDPLQVYQKLTELAVKVDPKSAQQFKQTATGLAQAFGFRLEEDVLASFGDVWTVHGTVASGPDQLAGTVVTVSLKNKEMLTKIQSLLLGTIKSQGSKFPFTIAETKIGDLPAWRIVPVQTVPASPAWAITEGRLVLAGSLETLKAHLGQGTDGRGLGELPAVASRLKTEPVLLTYQDTKTLVEHWIGLLSALGPTGTAALAQKGIKVEMPALPDFNVIAPHILPRTSTLRIAKQAIISEAFDTVPLVGSSLSAAPVVGVAIALLMPAVQTAREAARGNQSMNNLKMLALSMLNEESARHRLPPAAICDASGQPLLSWRVKLLPFLGATELYQEFHLDEPWDSEHNKPLVKRMPAVFANPRLGDLDGKTVYLVPTGKETIFFDDKGTSLKDVSDGTSKTILIVEVDAEHAVPWTKPDDLAIDQKKPADGLAHMPGNGALVVARADGSVLALPGDVDAATLWSFFTRAGGEAIAWPSD